MSRGWRSLMLALVIAGGSGQVFAQGVGEPELAARAWYLVDYGNALPIAARSPQSRLDPGALTKLMEAYIAFNALKAGTLQRTQTVVPSAHALAAPGPNIRLEAGKPVPIQDLLDGVVIVSANDAAIALAEALAGSEAALVEQMNREAQRLGLTDTQYRNVTGQPTAGHYTSARDLARLAAALIREHGEHYPRFARRDFVYRGQRLENRNRLLWLDPTIDGLKTAQTDTGGWSLVASAQRGGRRLIAVSLGAPSEAQRSQDMLRLINYGYQAFDTVKLYAANQALKTLEVWQGQRGTLDIGFRQDLLLAVPANRARDLKVLLQHRRPLFAPITRGDAVGTLQVSLDDRQLGEYPVVALQDVAAGHWLSRQWDRLRLWLKSI